jgi:hypothetical protein
MVNPLDCFLREFTGTPTEVHRVYDAEQFSLRTCRPDPQVSGDRGDPNQQHITVTSCGAHGYSG